MSIVHEAVCDGCGKREVAKYPGSGNDPVVWEMAEHPDGWFLVAISGNNAKWPSVASKVQGYCSRRCVTLEVE